jgi:filamentous hemagglutinin family protein
MIRSHYFNLCTTSLSFILLCAFSTQSYALPEGGVVNAGEASITASANKVDIIQNSQKAIIDWRGFDIGASEQTQFHQPNASSIAINRVNSPSPTQIDGAIKANGNVVIINQNGVAFGRSAKVDVNGLLATTADASNADLMKDGALHFNKAGNPNAAVINQGQINAHDAGLVGLVAPNVLNSGTINAKLGRVALSSGDTVVVDFYGDGLLQVAVSDKVKSQLVANTPSGKITADGGTIQITAAAGREIINSLISVEGVVQAQSVAQKNGEIIIAASGSNAIAGNIAENKGVKQSSSTVLIANANIDVSGRKIGERAGSIEVTADNIALLRGTVIDASGYSGASNTTSGKNISQPRIGAAGGDVKIGGDYLGKGATPAAKNLYVDKNAYVFADSINQGDAGRVIFWSDDTTQFYGNVFARALGGNPVDLTTLNATTNPYTLNSGNGGFVETSGRKNLDAGGYVNLTASNGERGTYLLDPTNITIYGNVDPSFQSTDGSIDLDGPLNDRLVLWLDSSDSSTISHTGGFVDQWRDKSGYENHANGSGVNRPLTGSRTMNGLNAIDFDGSNDVLIINDANSLDLSNELSFFNVNFRDSINTIDGLLAKRINQTTSYAYGFFFFNDNEFYVDIHNNNNRFSNNISYPTGSSIQSVTYNGALSTATRVNIFNRGRFILSGTEASASIPNFNSPLTIGELNGGTLTHFNGLIPEIILYNTELSGTLIADQSRNLIEQYQSAKWGVGLDPISGTAIGGGAEVAEATAHNSASPNDAATNGYSVFTTRYLERLSQSANVHLQASNDINLDLKGDTLNFSTAGRSLTLTAGNQITTASTGNITTNNGDINFNATNGISFNHAIELNAGTAGVNLNGGSGSLNLVNINAGSILARTTGASADITIPTSRTLTASGTNTAITLAAGRNIINNAGASALSANNGRWLLYSNNPTDTIGEQLLSSNFNRYNCLYSGCNAGVTIPTTGNGLIYSFVPTLTINGITSNKFFDGNTNAPLTNGSLSGILSGDTGITLNSSGVTGTFADSNVGSGKPITLSGSYSLLNNIYGYSLTQPTGITGNIDNNAGGGSTTANLPIIVSAKPVIAPEIVISNSVIINETKIIPSPPALVVNQSVNTSETARVSIPSTVEINSQFGAVDNVIANNLVQPIAFSNNPPLDLNNDNTIYDDGLQNNVSKSETSSPKNSTGDKKSGDDDYSVGKQNIDAQNISVMGGMLKIHPKLQQLFSIKKL